ncbi:5-formyltetrahydrofolate cyclo-ligase [Litorivivens lipolytica]|uniref:5-formyltetrahydrofolate cyclo-ligase n=1 Tax=Litorivivens lipolytica TaxID=1524264 RepID=A0A7W4Z6X3_9GAMM|nr:5-formyltetrahydrofolate cyclo-ligase [Litorivivens lipolytica]MBB3047326.1 5-formyltetrahydrofolate cyclo-ligase [Litorivivens lipolytica]
MTSLQKSELRRQLRERRRNLSAIEQRIASKALDRQLRTLPALREASKLALYLANDGEISPEITLRRLARMRRRCYLPCLKNKALQFRRFRPGQTLKNNRFQIPEPPPTRGSAVSVNALDVILLPLVGFDRKGNRLGMGGGFYDRTLAGLSKTDRPLLIGLAHHCQEVEQLPVQSWDIPLDAVATDKRVIWLKKR